MHKNERAEGAWVELIADAAKISGMPESQLRELVACGEVGHISSGRIRRVDMLDLQRWIAEQSERSKVAVW